MLSGVIKINNNRYPLTWIGEKAEHVATNHMSNPAVYPFLHMKVQQYAKTGKLYHEGNRYAAATIIDGNVLLVFISLMSGHAVIHTAYLTNHKNFENKKRQSVSGTKKQKFKPADFEISPESIAAGDAAGVSEMSVKKILARLFNGEKPLNKKR